MKKEFSFTSAILSLVSNVSTNSAKLDNLRKDFTNHLSEHKWERVERFIYFLLTVGLFCALKWFPHMMK